MPLPLPNLDTRRWTDLIEEGQALIPRYAPDWTDHNLHDPGILLMELLAWFVEQDIYRVNRIPDRHRRKFLALTGITPRPPQPAQTVLAVQLASDQTKSLSLPAGMMFLTGGGHSPALPFQTLAPLNVAPVQLQGIQVFDGTTFSDQTRLWREGKPIRLLGLDPQPPFGDKSESPAFYLAFDKALKGRQIHLWFWFAGPGSDLAERARLMAGAQRIAEACQPAAPPGRCSPADDIDQTNPAEEAEPEPLPPHHTVRTVWEYYDGETWLALKPEANSQEVVDETRGLTLDGSVRINVPGTMVETQVGKVEAKCYYLRCRLVAGPPDAAPILKQVALNAVPVKQVAPAYSTFEVDPNIKLDVESPTGKRLTLDFEPQEYQADGQTKTKIVLSRLASTSDPNLPTADILSYRPPTQNTPGELVTTLQYLGEGTGLPQQRIQLKATLVAYGQAQVWTLEAGGVRPWHQRADLDAATRTEAAFSLDAMAGAIHFGDGENGRVVPKGRPILVAYHRTSGPAGNVAPRSAWRLDSTNDSINKLILPDDPVNIAAKIANIVNPVGATGGADEEPLPQTIGRAVETLWAHERLLELCSPSHCASLDQHREQARQLPAPVRASTLLDFERLALDVPGTKVVRARAWANLDPAYPGWPAPGTVTVVIVPELPQICPAPTPGLLQAVKTYLNRRRVIGTRLVVVGPTYVKVTVRAKVQTKPAAALARVSTDIHRVLNDFLHPLHGGQHRRGWPFGRDVYRAEILQEIDNVPGVDHVVSLELLAGDGPAQDGNLCVGPTSLVTSGRHEIELL